MTIRNIGLGPKGIPNEKCGHDSLGNPLSLLAYIIQPLNSSLNISC